MSLINEDLKKLGQLKIPTSHRFKERGQSRKNLRQVPDIHSVKKTDVNPINSITSMIKALDVSSRVVDIAKKAPGGVWKISNQQVMDIARKYKFNVPNERDPTKHLGSTGIQMVMFKPGMYYLYKPHGVRKKKRKKNVFKRQHSKVIEGIF